VSSVLQYKPSADEERGDEPVTPRAGRGGAGFLDVPAGLGAVEGVSSSVSSARTGAGQQKSLSAWFTSPRRREKATSHNGGKSMLPYSWY
jgi:hypothetical protein